MTETTDHDPVVEAPEQPGTPRPPRRFNPRLALIYCLGALIIVLAFAVVMSIVNSDDGKGSRADSTTLIDGGQIKLGADDSTFTASTLPPTGLKTMDGAVTDLSAATAGRPTLVNMFSAACTACRTEMPALEKVHQAVGDELNVVGVNLGDSESVTTDFVAKTGVTYSIVRDPNLLLVTPLNITAQPMTLWVDADGKIVGHRYGALTDSEMRIATKDYLGITVPKA